MSSYSRIQGFDHLDRGAKFEVDRTVGEASESDYDGLVLPGGVANPDLLRMDENAVGFVRSFFEAGKPITSWPSLPDRTTGSCRAARPDDLPAFCEKLAEEICEGRHAKQAASTR